MIYSLQQYGGPVPEILGGYNDPLPNMEEMTEADFVKSRFFMYMAEYAGYRQIDKQRLADIGIGALYTMPVHWFMFADGTGVAFARGDRNATAGKVRYFKFAKCEHTYTEKNVGRCLTQRTCSKPNCGYSYTVDSSD